MQSAAAASAPSFSGLSRFHLGLAVSGIYTALTHTKKPATALRYVLASTER